MLFASLVFWSFSRKCSWFLVALERLRHSGQALLCSHIRFHPWFHQLAAFARTKMPAQFYAIHLRLETEYMRSFTGKLFILNGTAMDQCLVAKGWRPGADSVVYISSGQSIYRYPEVQHWLATSAFKFTQISKLLRGKKLEREEAGIVEALICVEAASFAGVARSTRSHYVRILREAKRNNTVQQWTMDNARADRFLATTFLWDIECPVALVQPGPNSSLTLGSRQNEEYTYILALEMALLDLKSAFDPLACVCHVFVCCCF